MLSNWKYAAIATSVATAVSSVFTQYNDRTEPWVGTVLALVAVVSALFSPVPQRKKNGDQSPVTKQ